MFLLPQIRISVSSPDCLGWSRKLLIRFNRTIIFQKDYDDGNDIRGMMYDGTTAVTDEETLALFTTTR